MNELTGKYRIYPINSYFQKRCLSVEGDSAEPWTPITISNYKENNLSQVFTFKQVGDKFKIVTSYNDQVFDVKLYKIENGSPIIQYPDNDGDNQHWDITKITKQIFSPIMMMLGIDVNKVPDTVYCINVLGFSLAISNDQAIIDNQDNHLYILEEVK